MTWEDTRRGACVDIHAQKLGAAGQTLWTGGGVGGAVGQGPEQGPTYLTVYLEVDSIDDHLARIEAAGGQTITPRTVIPDTVIFALFTDPAGNMVGLVEADSSAEPG